MANRRNIFERSPPSNWSSARKSRIKQILDKGLDYVSSEDSGGDGDVTLYRRPLSWIKSKYANSLKALDKVYYDSLSAKSKGMVRKREDGLPSEREVPSKPLDFVVIPVVGSSLDVSTDIETAESNE